MKGQAGVILAPTTTNDVATIVQHCFEARVGVVPYGGGTGLVGGQVCESGPTPVILSLERMNSVRGLSLDDDVLTVDAGVLLADVRGAAQKAGRLFALSLASEGSCQIGGNLATNAGGIQVLRYGSARDLCLGVEAVMPDGSILNGLSRLHKDNTGYDLRDLLIGSEGTLGVITGASLRLVAPPKHSISAFVQVPDPTQAVALLGLCKDAIGDSIYAFELISGRGFEFLRETQAALRLPFALDPAWSVLIDAGGDDEIALSARIESVLAAAHQSGLVMDALISQSESQRDAFWQVRESIPEANRKIGSIYSHDISVPVGRIPEFIARADKALLGLAPFRINCFGHLGDGNLHYNVFPETGRARRDYDGLRDTIKETVYELVHELEGSISAEHGIGRLKTGDLNRYSDPTKIKAMRSIKAAIDPRGIMNPGAIFGSEPN